VEPLPLVAVVVLALLLAQGLHDRGDGRGALGGEVAPVDARTAERAADPDVAVVEAGVFVRVGGGRRDERRCSMVAAAIVARSSSDAPAAAASSRILSVSARISGGSFLVQRAMASAQDLETSPVATASCNSGGSANWRICRTAA
jgi:hypothetical protein